MTETSHWAEKPITTAVYQVNRGWYLEVVVPHPDNPEMPNQLMTIKCDNEWWARFLEYCIESLPIEPLTYGPDIVRTESREMFDADAPEFRYEG